MQRKSNSSLAQGRTAKLRPYPHVSVLVWKRNFFSSFSKKFASTRSVFWSFTPVHTFTMNRLKTTTYPTAHAWPIPVKGQETLNKFLILRGVDWNLQCDLSVVFVCPHVHAKTAFSRSSVFIDRFHRIRVDGSRIRKEKVAFSNEKGYVFRVFSPWQTNAFYSAVYRSLSFNLFK